MLVFTEGEKPEKSEKTLGARTRTNNKLNPYMTPGPGIEPRPHWWEASALTTAPSLLPLNIVLPFQTTILQFQLPVLFKHQFVGGRITYVSCATDL